MELWFGVETSVSGLMIANLTQRNHVFATFKCKGEWHRHPILNQRNTMR